MASHAFLAISLSLRVFFSCPNFGRQYRYGHRRVILNYRFNTRRSFSATVKNQLTKIIFNIFQKNLFTEKNLDNSQNDEKNLIEKRLKKPESNDKLALQEMSSSYHKDHKT